MTDFSSYSNADNDDDFDRELTAEEAAAEARADDASAAAAEAEIEAGSDNAARLPQEQINEFVMAAHHDLDKVRTLLAQTPALIDENADWFETPIEAATHVGRTDIINFLMENGAELDICAAAFLGRIDEVQTMLTDDPGLYEAVGAHNIPVLYYPVIGGHNHIAQVLYDAGAAVNTDDGVTSPLHGAALFGQTDMARWLLAHDANPYSTDYDGKTALDRAEERGETEIAALIRPFFDTDQADAAPIV